MVDNNLRLFMDSLTYRLGCFQSFIPEEIGPSPLDQKNSNKWPLISICIAPGEAEKETTINLIKSLLCQTIMRWEICIVCSSSNLRAAIQSLSTSYSDIYKNRIRTILLKSKFNEAAALNLAASHAAGTYLVFPKLGSIFLPDAIRQLSQFLHSNPKSLVYYDSLIIKNQEYIEPCFHESRFSIEYFECFDYIQDTFAVRTADFHNIGGLNDEYDYSTRYDLLFRIAEQFNLTHVNIVLSEATYFDNNEAIKDKINNECFNIVKSHLKRIGKLATVELKNGGITRHIVYSDSIIPMVSIIIISQGFDDSLTRLLSSIAEKTIYDKFEVILVMKQCLYQQQAELFKKAKYKNLRIRITDCTNFYDHAEAFDSGCTIAQGSFYLFLDKETEVINPFWLSEMVSIASQPIVGCVGAMLYHQNSTIQHAGITIDGNGKFCYPFYNEKRGSCGYLNRLVSIQQYQAVSRICLLTPAFLYDSIEGASELLTNSSDGRAYCRRVDQEGFKVLWTPFAELYNYQADINYSANTIQKHDCSWRKADSTPLTPCKTTPVSTSISNYIQCGIIYAPFPNRTYVPKYSNDEVKTLLSSDGCSRLKHLVIETAKQIWSFTPKIIKRSFRKKHWGSDGIEINGVEYIESLKDYDSQKYPFGINVYGPLRKNSEAGRLAINLSECLSINEIEHTSIDYSTIVDNCYKNQDKPQRHLSAPKYNISLFCIDSSSFLSVMGNMSEGQLDYRYKILYLVNDCDTANSFWNSKFDAFDEIWVRSRFSFDVIKRRSSLPVIYIPEYVQPFSTDTVTLSDLPKNDFLVLCIFQTRSSFYRTNPIDAIDVFFSVFYNKQDDAKLILCAQEKPTLAEQEAIRAHIPDMSRVVFKFGPIDSSAQKALIASCDVLLSMHHQMDFGYTLIEAALSNTRIIATGWSGNMDYMSKAYSYCVDYTLVETDNKDLIESANQQAHPHIDIAAKQLREFFEQSKSGNISRIPELKYIKEHYSAYTVGLSIRTRLDSIQSFSTIPKLKYSPWSILEPPQAYDLSAYPNGVNLFGFFEAENGLAQGGRLYAAAMDAVSINPTLIDADILPELKLTRGDHTYSSRLSTPDRNINVFCINSPEYMSFYRKSPQSYFDKRYNIGVWLWELEDFPSLWVEGFKYIDELWVPSSFIRDAALKVSPVPVKVMPYGIEPKTNPAYNREYFGLPSDDFLVLFMYDTNSYMGRKNPQGSLDAFFKAFGRNSKNVKLVLKIREPNKRDLQILHEQIGECSNVIIVGKSLSREATNSLIACCNVYMSLHRSEGFGLTMAEAMYLGVPTIGTNWSANIDFMNPDIACMVDYNFIPTGNAYFDTKQNARWANPDPNHAAKFLRLLFEDHDAYMKYSQAGSAYIKNHLSFMISGQRMLDRINEILSNRRI